MIVHELSQGGAALADGRLRVGDVIRQVNDQPLQTADVDYANACISRCVSSVQLLVHRVAVDETQLAQSLFSQIDKQLSDSSANPLLSNDQHLVMNGCLYQLVDLQLAKRPAKGLGLSVTDSCIEGPGSHITDIHPNGPAATDGRLRIGDHVMSVNGHDVSVFSGVNALMALKCAQGVIRIKVARLQPGQVIGSSSNQKVFKTNQ